MIKMLGMSFVILGGLYFLGRDITVESPFSLFVMFAFIIFGFVLLIDKRGKY